MVISDQDVEKLKGVFATKKDLESWTKALYLDLASKEDLVRLENRLKENFATKDEMFTYFDKVMKQLEDIKTEKIVIAKQLRCHDDGLEDHERRIKTLELESA